MDRHIFRCVDADAYLAAFGAKHANLNIVSDADGFAGSAGENQQGPIAPMI
jgi:hypothetical protein